MLLVDNRSAAVQPCRRRRNNESDAQPVAWQHEKITDLRGIVRDLANLHFFSLYFDFTFCACYVTLCLCVTIFVFVAWVLLLCGFGATPRFGFAP